MTRKNDIFLIMAYTPDRFKENLLRDLINGLRELDQDILLVSHTIQSQDIIDSVDYYIYDKENLLLKTYETECYSTFDHGSIKLQSQLNCFHATNHSIAALKLVYTGLSMAKILGYKKLIQIEYDTKINNINYLPEVNSRLNEYECLYFGNDEFSDGQIYGFNLDAYDFNEIVYDENFLRKEIADVDNWGMAEKIFLKTLIKTKKYLICSRDERDENLIVDLSNKNEIGLKYMLTPIYRVDNDTVYFLFYNKCGRQITYDVILNNQIVHRNGSASLNEFELKELCRYDELNTLQFIVNNTDLYFYDFINDNYLKEVVLKQKSIITF
jgi:hypothetical protein